jgi:hypothetical protein
MKKDQAFSVYRHQVGAVHASHVGIENMGPLAVFQFEDALDFLLSSVVVEKDIDTAAQEGLGLVSELLDFGKGAEISGDELELGRRGVLLDVLGKVLDILDLLLVVMQ